MWYWLHNKQPQCERKEVQPAEHQSYISLLMPCQFTLHCKPVCCFHWTVWLPTCFHPSRPRLTTHFFYSQQPKCSSPLPADAQIKCASLWTWSSVQVCPHMFFLRDVLAGLWPPPCITSGSLKTFNIIFKDLMSCGKREEKRPFSPRSTWKSTLVICHRTVLISYFTLNSSAPVLVSMLAKLRGKRLYVKNLNTNFKWSSPKTCWFCWMKPPKKPHQKLCHQCVHRPKSGSGVGCCRCFGQTSVSPCKVSVNT